MVQVFTKDWHHDRAAVLRQIDDALAGIAPEPIEVEEPPLEVAPPIDEPQATPEPVPVEAIEPTPPRPSPISVTAANSALPGVARYFTCLEEGASKFWEVVVNGGEMTVRFGRIGTKGQSQTKAFPTPEVALREQEKLIRSKVGKGYVETLASQDLRSRELGPR